MTILATLAGFQTIHRAIPGVKSAPVAMPVRLNADGLPFVFTFPGPTTEGRGWSASAGWYEHRRTYVVRVYVRILGTGTGVDEGYQEAIELLQRFGETYMLSEVRNLGGLVAHLGPSIEDSGYRADLQWSAAEDAPYYHGFQFSIEVAEKVI